MFAVPPKASDPDPEAVLSHGPAIDCAPVALDLYPNAKEKFALAVHSFPIRNAAKPDAIWFALALDELKSKLAPPLCPPPVAVPSGLFPIIKVEAPLGFNTKA